MEGESFKPRLKPRFKAYVFSSLAYFVAACGLADSMAAYGGLRRPFWAVRILKHRSSFVIRPILNDAQR